MLQAHWSVSFALCLAVALSPPAASGDPCGEGNWYPLIAGQHLDVGRVTVWNDEDRLYVRIETADGWLLEETAVHVGASLDDIPATRDGVPIPGRFEHRREHDADMRTTYEIPRTWPPDTELVIAVHASVRRPASDGGGSQEETAWGGNERGPGPRWWFVIRYVPDPCDDDEDDDEPPTGEGGTGCTPGYWVNHPQVWSVTGFHPDDRVSSVFRSTRGTAEGSRSLIEALPIEGDSTLSGAIRILIRHAVAAVLNAAHPDVDYALSVDDVVRLVNEAVESGSRERILSLKDRLDRHNNSGCRLGNAPRVGGGNGGDDRVDDRVDDEAGRDRRGDREGEKLREERRRQAEMARERERREADKERGRGKREADKARGRGEREADKANERGAEKHREGAERDAEKARDAAKKEAEKEKERRKREAEAAKKRGGRN